MPSRAYIHIVAHLGPAKRVRDAVANLKQKGVKILSVEVVTGPFDVIALLEADDLEALGRAVDEGIQKVDGVMRTTTSVVLKVN